MIATPQSNKRRMTVPTTTIERRRRSSGINLNVELAPTSWPRPEEGRRPVSKDGRRLGPSFETRDYIALLRMRTETGQFPFAEMKDGAGETRAVHEIVLFGRRDQPLRISGG